MDCDCFSATRVELSHSCDKDHLAHKAKNIYCLEPGVAHAFNPITWELEAGEWLWVQDQPGVPSKVQTSWG